MVGFRIGFSGAREVLAAGAVVGLLAVSPLTGCGGKGDGPPATGPAGEAAAPAKKIGEAEYKAFSEAFKVEGFEPQAPASISGMGTRAQLAAKPKDNGVKLQLEVAYSACDSFICPKLDLASVKANQDNLKRNLPTMALENPDLVHEIFEMEVGGEKIVAIYTLHLTAKKTPDGGTSKSSANSIDLTWHDGAQLVTVKARATDWGAESQAQLAERTPRAELEAAAKAALLAARKAMPK